METIDTIQLEIIQKELAQKVVISKNGQGYIPENEDIIFSLDVQYVGEQAYVALDVMRWNGELLGIFGSLQTATFPYIPQFFSFREAPILINLIKAVQQKTGFKPSLLIIDGHGVAHPRRFGVACYVGIETQIPTIGCAKEPLLRYEGNLGNERGSSISLFLENEEVGSVLRTQNGVKPVFVSAGHLTSLEVAKQVILTLSTTYRISEPLRRADHAARCYAKGENLPNFSIV